MTASEDLDILIKTSVGVTGRFQIILMFLFFYSRMPANWYQLVVVIIGPPVGNFTCSDPSFSRCDKACPSHTYDHSVWERTIIHEWDLVCDRDYLQYVCQTLVMFGILVGNVVFGYWADRFGRRGPLLFGVVLQFVSGVAVAFAPTLWSYITLRWISTFACGGTMMPTFVILMEFIDSKYRKEIGILFTLPCHIAHALLGLIGYLCRRWNHIQLITTVPTAVLLSYWCIVPESPRWLMTMGKAEQVTQVLETIAKCNKLPTEDIKSKVEQFLKDNPSDKNKKGGNIVDLFRSKRMSVKTIILFFNWFIVAMEYYAVSQYMGQIGGNVFLNIGVAGLLQIVGNIISCYLVNKIGTKRSLLISYVLCSIPMFVISAVPSKFIWVSQVMGCISNMAIAVSFAIMYVYSGELYPTVVRTIGMGMSSMFGRYGSMIAPFITMTREIRYWIPPLIFCIFPVVAAASTYFFLPDTKDSLLPDTVEEADKM